MKMICLFSSYSENCNIEYYIKYYLLELTKHFDEIYFLTNDREIDTESKYFLQTNKIRLNLLPNRGYDFGMYWHIMKDLNLDDISSLALVNDSCYLFKPLDDFFKWHKAQELDVSGFTNCHINAHHIQSYFLCFSKRTLQEVKNYFITIGILDDIKNVIDIYEIGLSEHLTKRSFVIGVMFPDINNHGHNTMVESVPRLLRNGIPLIKRKVMNNTFNVQERDHLIKIGYNFNLNYRRLLPIEDTMVNNLMPLRHSSTSAFDDNNIYVYQIYYDDLQLPSLSDDVIPYYNENLTVYFENDIIRSLYSKIAGEYFGVLSWNFVVKNKLQFKTSYISGNHDIYLFDGTSIVCNVLEYSQYYHPRFKEIFNEVLKNLNIDQRRITMGFGIFTNAVVARSSIYKEYMDNFLLPTMDFLDNLDGDLKEVLWSDSNYEQTDDEIISKIFEHTGKPYYTYHAFICERLWSVFYELNKYKYSVKIISKSDVEINEL